MRLGTGRAAEAGIPRCWCCCRCPAPQDATEGAWKQLPLCSWSPSVLPDYVNSPLPAGGGFGAGWGEVLVSCAPRRGCGAPGAQWDSGDAFLAVHCSVEEHSGASKLLAAEWCGGLSEGLRGWLGSCRRLGELLPSPLPSLHVLSSLQPPCSVAGCRRKVSVPCAWGQGAAG